MPKSSAPSTDDLRGSERSDHLLSVTFKKPMKLTLGGELPEVSCAYETYGTLNEDKSNAVLICHALTGDSHVARHSASDLPGWWDRLVGPGKAVDTNQYFVICANALGSCYGTTGPSSLNPNCPRQEHYGPDFPQVTIEDMVDLQCMLLDHLKIKSLAAVIGGSMGGHQALIWATRYPQRVQHCCLIATSPRLSSQAISFDVIGRNAIHTDPAYHEGRYERLGVHPDVGLAIARMLGHITYLSSEAMAEKFEVDRHHPRELDTFFEKRFSVGSYLAYQGHKFVERFDANSYLSLSMAMDLMDLGADQAALRTSLSSATCSFTIISFSSDWLFPPSQSIELLKALNWLNRPVSYLNVETAAGHDGFLIESDIDQYAPMIAAGINAGLSQKVSIPKTQLNIDEQRLLELIHPGESVLDLGCGHGDLLAALRARGESKIKLQGVELAHDAIIATARRGLCVQQHDLNLGLIEFPDRCFDVAVLSATLQAVANIEQLLDEILRVANRGILSFANFAHKSLRDIYTRQGLSPKAEGRYHYDWYNTPNRRFPSILDVENLLDLKGAAVDQAIYLDTHHGRQLNATEDYNYLADTAILVISAK